LFFGFAHGLHTITENFPKFIKVIIFTIKYMLSIYQSGFHGFEEAVLALEKNIV